MRKHWLYLKYLLRHKWFVFHEGRKIGVNWWQLLVHDWHKFLPDEWFPYVEYFYGDDIPTAARKAWLSDGMPIVGKEWYEHTVKEKRNREFREAWERHIERSYHHWETWQYDDEPMPLRYLTEMIADWKGAAKVQGNDVLEWYEANRKRIVLHPDTADLL